MNAPTGSPVRLRVVVAAVDTTGLTEVRATIRSAVEALGRDDEVVLLAEPGAVSALELASRQLGSGEFGPQIGLAEVEDLGSAGLVDVACGAIDGGDLATFVMFIEPGIELLPGAAGEIRRAIAHEPDVDIVYGDAAVSTSSGAETSELRPGWSPDRLRVNNYLGPVVVYRASLLAGLNPMSSHDLALLASERARAIAHVPALLARGDTHDRRADAVAVGEHIDRLDLPMRLSSDAESLLEPALTRRAKVSIVIPTGGVTRSIAGQEVLLVANAIASLLVTDPDPDVEIVVVLDANAPDELGQLLHGLDPDRIVVARDPKPFNFSGANNLGVAHSTGELLIFLNDDTEVVDPGWIDRVRMHLGVPGVGIVGARLLFGSGAVQHAGLVARDGYIEHRFGGYPDDASSRPAAIENVGAVTGACLGISRALFDELGQFPVEFPLNFNDVHLCFAAWEAGQRVVIDHDLVLVHHETSSRDAGITGAEQAAFEARWPVRSQIDPFDHPAYVAVRAQPLAPPAALLRMRSALGHARGDVRMWSQPVEAAT